MIVAIYFEIPPELHKGLWRLFEALEPVPFPYVADYPIEGDIEGVREIMGEKDGASKVRPYP